MLGKRGKVYVVVKECGGRGEKKRKRAKNIKREKRGTGRKNGR